MRLEVKSNKLHLASAKLQAEAVEIVEDIASRIESEIATGLADTKLPVRRDVVRGGLRQQIRVGNRRRFYPAFREYGTRLQPARPVVTPAAEHARPEWNSRMRRLLRRL